MRVSSVADVSLRWAGEGEGEGWEEEEDEVSGAASANFGPGAFFFRRLDFSAGWRRIDVKNVSSSRSVGVVMGSTKEGSEDSDAVEIVEVDDADERVFRLLRAEAWREVEEEAPDARDRDDG